MGRNDVKNGANSCTPEQFEEMLNKILPGLHMLKNCGQINDNLFNEKDLIINLLENALGKELYNLCMGGQVQEGNFFNNLYASPLNKKELIKKYKENYKNKK